MVDFNTNFYKIINNLEKIKDVGFETIIQSNLKYTPKVTIAIPTYKRSKYLRGYRFCPKSTKFSIL